MSEFQIPASIVKSTGLFPTATTAASVPALAETAKTGLFGFDPASIAFSLFVNSILNKERLLTETPMTPEEAAKFAAQQRLETALGGVGEGAGEFLLDAIEQARAANVTPEQIAETLNTRGDLASELIGLTVGSNQPFVGVEPAGGGGGGGSTAASTDSSAGSIGSLEPDADLMGTSGIPDSTELEGSTVGEGDITTTNVSGVKAVTGIEGDIDTTGWVRTSELGADTMVYENVLTGETFNIDMKDVENLPANEKAAIETVNQRTDAAVTTAPSSTNTGTSTGTNNNVIDLVTSGLLNAANVLDSKKQDANLITGPFQTPAEADAAAAANAAILGDDFNIATDSNNTGKTLTVGDTNGTGDGDGTGNGDGSGNGGNGDGKGTGDTNGTDITGDTGEGGGDGTGNGTGNGSGDGTGDGTGSGGGTGDGIGDGTGNGKNGKDGKDGKDGIIGLFSSIQNTPITESILFTPRFTKLENVQQGMFDAFLRAAGGNR